MVFIWDPNISRRPKTQLAVFNSRLFLARETAEDLILRRKKAVSFCTLGFAEIFHIQVKVIGMEQN